MCVICVCINRPLTETEISNSFRTNNHGAGMSWNIHKNLAGFAKGFMNEEELTHFYFDNKINEKLPHVVHFRKASSGTVNKYMTHPFIVSANSPLYIAGKTKSSLVYHNGTMSDWKKTMFNFFVYNKIKIPTGEFSDSRFIAILTSHLGKEVLKLIGGKFVLYDTKESKTFTYGDFVKDNGVLFSNNSYTQIQTIMQRTIFSTTERASLSEWSD